MKKSVLLLVSALLILCSWLSATALQIRLNDVVEIGNRNAAQMWGTVYAAEPIPYYGPDEEIIAYHLNYSLKGSFPDPETLKTRCDEALNNESRESAWGVGDYGNMVIGAKPYMPVFIQVSKSLSEQYAYGRKLEKAAREAFPDGYTEGKTYYLGYVHVWHQVSYKNTNKYINLMPSVKVISEEEFTKLKGEIVYFWTRNTFDDEWQQFMVNGETMGRSEVYIPGENKMPYYEWSYGCTPTSGAMILAWWDRYKGMGRFVSSHYERWDPVQHHTDYHVPTLQHEMAQAMDTGDGGTTYLGDVIDAYYEVVENHGYRCVSDGLWAFHHTDTTLFNEVKRQINQGLPCQVDIWGHTLAAVGYNSSPKLVYVHDPNHSSMMQIHKSSLWSCFWVYVYDDSGNNGSFLELTEPNGGTYYNSDGGGETLLSGSIYEILWDSPHANTTASIGYSMDAGEHWPILVTDTENDGSYCWLVPELNPVYYPEGSSDKGRVRITVRDQNHELLAADGSYGNFRVRPGGSFPFLDMSYTFNLPKKFAKVNHNGNSWGVVSVKSDNNENRCSVELFDDLEVTDFTNSVMLATGNNITNYIVIDNRTLPEDIYGVKFNRIYPNGGSNSVRAGFRNAPVTLTMGTHALDWFAPETAKIWDIWLEPGNHYFQLDVDEETADLDLALFKSGGTGMFNRDGAVASSQHVNLGYNESFQYTVTQAGYYGILVTSNTYIATSFNLMITDSSVWTGNVSRNWHWASNWLPQRVPGPNDAVMIPAGCANYPLITSVNAPAYTQCKSLLIKTGASITVEDRYFEVVGDMQVFGKVRLISSTSEFLVSGSVTWENLGTLYFGHENAKFQCCRNWTAKSGSYLTAPYRGKVEFISWDDTNIICLSSSFSFPSLILNKENGATVTYSSASNHDLAVENELYIGANSSFCSSSQNSIVIKGNFTNLGSFTFEAGTVRLLGQFGTLVCPSGSYFNNLDISTSLFTTLLSDLHIRGNFTINSGGFLAGDNTIYVGGNWKNNMGTGGFQKATSTVVFNGDGVSMCYGELFANLIIDNPNCELTFVGSVSSIDNYTWIAGALVMGGSTLTINNILSNGLYGTYYVGSGTLNIHRDSTQLVDLVGTFYIFSGTVNIYGGSSPSIWTNGGNLTLLMRGGVLDFKDVGILIAPSASTTMNIDITNGVIRTTGDFIVSRTDFNPVGGSVELYGSSPANVSITSPSTIPNLIINKDGRSADTVLNTSDPVTAKSSAQLRTSDITLLTNLNISGDLIIPMGTFNLCGKTVIVGNDLEIYGKLKMISAMDLLQVYGSVYWYDGSSSEISRGLIDCFSDWNYLGGTANLTGINLCVFKGSSPSLIHTAGAQAFANVSFAKSSTTYGQNLITLDSDAYINGDLSITDRSRMIVSGADVSIGGKLTHQGLSQLFIPEGNTITCNDLDLYGNLMVDGGIFTVQDDFIQRTGSELSVEGGNFILDAPYTGAHMSFAGYTVINGGTFEITNEGIQFGTTSNFILSGGAVKIGWGLRAPIPDTFHQTSGTIEFAGTRTAAIELAAGNYLHNVLLTKTGTGTLMLPTDATLNNLTINSGTMLVNHKSLNVNGNVNIVGGSLNAAFYDDFINVSGNWTNSRGAIGFIEGSGTVAFTGNHYSEIKTSETFNILQINKSTAFPLELSVGATLTADSYEFITGVLHIHDSSTLNTPIDGFVIPMGSALRCATGTPPTINLYGNFVDHNMVIDWYNGFSCGSSIVNVLGTGNRQIASYAMKFNDFNVNLSSGSCHFSDSYSPIFTGDVHLISGTLSAENGCSFTFHKGLSTNAGTTLALPSCSLTFVGNEDAELSVGGSSDYSSLMIAKEIGSSVSLASTLNAPAASMLTVQQGKLDLSSQMLNASGNININSGAEILANANAQLRMPSGSMLNVNNGGKLSALGSSSQPALISRIGEAYYSVNVYSGGSIAAEHAIFEYLEYGGVNINSGATVVPEFSFNYCTFRNGTYGGNLLNINNEQNLTINNAVFPANTWFGMSNVSKNVNTGSVRFINESGAFAGAGFESDPYMRINWNSQAPAIAANTGSLSFGDVYMPMSGFLSFILSNSGSGSLVGTLSLPDDFTASIYRAVNSYSKADEPQRTSNMDFLVLPSSSVEVQVTFSPRQPIAYNTNLVISHNAGGSPVSIALTGNGMGAQITVNPTQIIKGILPGGSHTETLNITDSGNTALSYYATIEYPTRSRDVIMSESFETSFPPSGWSTAVVQQSGTAGVWSRATTTVHPGGFYPQDGSYLAIFNSWTCSTGNQTRLQTGFLNFSGYSSISLSFLMYHDSAYPASNDRIQVQIYSGQTWENVGEPVVRTQSPYGWQQHSISLSAYGNQTYLRLGLLGISQYGNDLNLDNIVITGSNPPTGWLFFNGQAPSVSNIIAPGISDQHQVSINTSGMEPGIYNAEIHIASNDPITSVKVVPITVSVGNPGLSVSPTYLPYPLLELGSECLYGLTLSNSGAIHLRGTILLPAGYHIQPMARTEGTISAFSQSADRWSSSEAFILAPGQIGSYVVRFAPTAVQTYNGNIVISTDHLANVNVPVTGSGGIVPSVVTGGIGDLTKNSVTMYGSITDSGGMTITSKGFYYGTDPDPREYGEMIISQSSGNSFTAAVSGLDSRVQYYYCAFAVNTMGPGVGEVYLFNTPGSELVVSATSLPSFGNVQINTSSEVQSFTVSGSGLLGDVTISIPTGFRLTEAAARTDGTRTDNQIVLSPSGGYLPQTTINVYFQPTTVASYTETITISTEDVESQTITVSGNGISIPVITTNAVSEITTNSALTGGNVVSDGGNPILSKGVCWSLLPNPSIANAHTNDGSGTGAYLSTISPLNADSYYYARAYAIYASGTVYGDCVQFVTLAETPGSAPANLSIQIIGDYLTLDWNPVPAATSYIILSSDTPNGSFSKDFTGVFNGTTWTAPISASAKFYQVVAVGGASSKFVSVPAGTFTMGRTSGTGDPDEIPIHDVTLDAFYMGRTEITQKEWQDIMGSNPATGYGVGDTYPVYNVSWYSVIKYCNLRSLAEGLMPAYTIASSTNPNNWGAVPADFNPAWDNAICNWNANGYRLPTEAEWEYAARGATSTPDYVYAGANEINLVAWYYENSPAGNKPVSGKAPNALGIYDMSGNANEMCWDWADSYSSSPSENPTGPASGIERIRRGGFWNANANYCRVAQRDSSYPFIANEHLGFRLCKSAQASKSTLEKQDPR